jgi:hypothetical protein
MLAMAMALTSLGLVPQPRASHDLNVYITISAEFEGSGKWAEILPVTDSSGQEVWALRTRLGRGISKHKHAVSCLTSGECHKEGTRR